MEGLDRRIGMTLVVLGLLLGVWMRVTGLTRGESDFVLPEAQREGVEVAFYTFHPDEETLIRAALDLDWRSPVDPPLTAYGLMPLYLARLVLVGEESLDAGPEVRRRIYLRVRVLAVLLSCALVWLVWVVGKRMVGDGAAILAAAFTAFVPLAVQQAHFFTVDGVFAACVLLFFCALARALDVRTYGRYVLVGLAIGATAAVRLNGVVLGLVLVVGHCAGGSWREGLGRLKEGKLWAAELVGLAMLLVLQPYLLVDPGRLLRADSTDDFGYSLQVAQGEALRMWSLADLHTVPYAHYWTDLWPQSAGWPLTLFFAGGVLLALWRRRVETWPLLAWCLVYFALVGGLHTKHVRYLLPLLPLLSLFAAALCREVWQRQRRAGVLVAAMLVGYTAFYGVAFSSIYTAEDSRIQAARWIDTHVEVGARIGVEAGGFSMQGLVSDSKYARSGLNMGTLFGARDYLSCGAAVDFLTEQVHALDYIAVVDVNRYRQFVAAPEVAPVASAFYRHLWDGTLGFTRVYRAKNYPRFMGLRFDDDGAEPSFLGYDHPAVSIFRRREGAEEVWREWRGQMTGDARCADDALGRAASHYGRGAWEEALAQVRSALGGYPEMRALYFVEGAVYQKLGRGDEEKRAFGRYVEGYQGENAYLVPWATSATLLAAGVPDLALAALRHGVQLGRMLAAGQRRDMATSYVRAGDRALRLGYATYAGAIYHLALEVLPGSPTYVALGMVLYEQGQIEASAKAYEQALALDGDHAVARINYGWNLYVLGRWQEAVDQFRRALTLGSHNAAAFNLGLALLAQGQVEEAREVYERAVEEYGAEEAIRLGSVEELRALVEQGGVGWDILQRHWGEDAGL